MQDAPPRGRGGRVPVPAPRGRLETGGVSAGRRLNGFDPEQNPRLGFYYAVRDAELGEQVLSVGSDFLTRKTRRCGACWN